VLIALLLINVTLELEFASAVTVDLNMYKKKKTKNLKIGEMQKEEKSSTTSEEGVIQECWAHYFDFMETSEIPQMFHKNELYEQQLLHANEIKNKDKDADLIPSDTHFYVVLQKNGLSFYKDKNNLEETLKDTIFLENIRPIPEDAPKNGAVQGVDKYSEGYCFRVATSEGDTSKEMEQQTTDENAGRRIWLICTERKQEAESLMNNLIDLKIASQKENGLTITAGEQKDLDDTSEFKPKKGSNDGYWQIVKDWGDCTKACGGGKQYRQLVCIKPAEDSKDCEGSNVRERDCNTFPCPVELTPEKDKADQNIDFEKNDIKFLPISNKPLKYDKCVIMERDAILLRYPDQKTIKERTFKREPIEKEKIAIRLVMNLDTITAYLDDQYKVPIQSVNIRVPNLKFENLNGKGNEEGGHHCFSVSDGVSTIEACQINCNDNELSFVEEWNYHINEFRECKPKDETVEQDIEFENEVQNLKNELEKKKMEEIRRNEFTKELVNIQNINKKHDIEIQSYLQREKKLEELIEKEEEAKGMDEYRELQLQMEEEQKKAGCLLNELKNKEQIDSIKSAKIEAEQKRSEATRKAQKQLDDMRKASQKRIKELQKINARRLKSLKDKIELIRIDTAGKIRSNTSNGHTELCKIATKEDESKIELYCGKAYLDDPNKYMECRNYDTFCFVCCEHETNNANDREKCYKNNCNPFVDQFGNPFTQENL
jgi:hypothetical protein